MKYIISIILISYSWALGLQSISIPRNGYTLSTAGTGIADGRFASLNPAISKIKNPYIQFSLNNWLDNIKGSQTSVYWGRKYAQSVSIQSWNAKDIPLWGDNPDSKSLGSFGVHHILASYSLSYQSNSIYKIGFALSSNYSHLFSESISSISIDIGALIKVNSFINAGFVFKNIGIANIKKINSDLPYELGFGIKINLPKDINILADAISTFRYGIEQRYALKTNWKYINFYTGMSINKYKNGIGTGLSLNYNGWSIIYGIYNHKNSNLGLPQFFDIRYYF